MKIDFTKLDGLIPAVIQDKANGRVLMVGFMNHEAFQKTLDTGKVTFYSRSRDKLWTKGDMSGHYLLSKEIRVDCDEDTLVIQVEVLGPGVCHNGFRSCFYRRLEGGEWKIFDVTIDGISLVTIYRASYARIIQTAGLDGLILRLENKTAESR
mgnify:CR=1 FL=1